MKVLERIVIIISLVLFAAFIIWGYFDYQSIRVRNTKKTEPGDGISYRFEQKNGEFIYNYKIINVNEYNPIEYIQEKENERLNEKASSNEKQSRTTAKIVYYETMGHNDVAQWEIQLSNYYYDKEGYLRMTPWMQVLYVPSKNLGHDEYDTIIRYCASLKDIQLLVCSTYFCKLSKDYGFDWARIWSNVIILN